MTPSEKYNNDGYLIVKSVIDNDTIENILHEIYEKQKPLFLMGFKKHELLCSTNTSI